MVGNPVFGLLLLVQSGLLPKRYVSVAYEHVRNYIGRALQRAKEILHVKQQRSESNPFCMTKITNHQNLTNQGPRTFHILRFLPQERKGQFMMKSSKSTCSCPPRLVLLVPHLGLCQRSVRVAVLVCTGSFSTWAYHAGRVSSWLKNWIWTCWPPCLLLT